jgi:glycyl-tRNA synthetase beta chain
VGGVTGTSDFLLELLSEEIPARMQAKASADLARLFGEQLAEAGLEAQAIETYVTPRRLALIARGLPVRTEAVTEEVKGPRASAPPQALEGFLRKVGLAREQLVERDGVLFATIDRPGRATAAVLAEAIPAIVRAFPWPKSMRWGAASAAADSPRWVRPLQGIVALLGEDIVEFEIAGVRSGAATVGHRFHHPGLITLGGAHDYVEKLRACHVVVDQEERKALIRQRAAEAADTGEIVPDEGLVAENAGLTELPMPLIGRFDPAFLDLPPELIRLTMRVNQKYFACQSEGGLLPHFVFVANLESSDPATVIAGNEKVLAARLADARFFWEHDLKIPLEQHGRKLEQIVFHEKLGTLAEKVERVARLAQWMMQERIVKGADPAQLLTAARLAKADLGTELVGEFPELQGVIGSYYARAQGQPDAVANAIRDHYKPAGQGDEVPTDPITVAVNLADRLDTLVAFFSIGERPSGSRDPFALRRAALGFLQILTRAGLRVSLGDMLTQAAVLLIVSRMGALASVTFPDLLDSEDHEHEITAEVGSFTYRHGDHVVVRWKSALTPNLERGKVIEEATDLAESVLDFFADRLKVQQREAGVRHDLIDAVFALGGEDDLVRLLARVNALQAFVEKPEGTDLLAGYKRAANILKKEDWTEDGVPRHPPSFETAPEEAALIGALDTLEPKAEMALADEEFERAMAVLARLREPVDAFFDKVTVNDPDPVKRRARLNLLARLRALVDGVADFSKIEG